MEIEHSRRMAIAILSPLALLGAALWARSWGLAAVGVGVALVTFAAWLIAREESREGED